MASSLLFPPVGFCDLRQFTSPLQASEVHWEEAEVRDSQDLSFYTGIFLAAGIS